MNNHGIFSDFKTGLEDILREGARKLLQQAIENEVVDCLELYKNKRDPAGHRIVKKNGYLPERQIQTGLGPLTIKKPRIRGIAFTSAILPRYMRRAPEIL